MKQYADVTCNDFVLTYEYAFLLLGLTLIAELGGYLGLFLGYSLMNKSIFRFDSDS